MFEILNHLDRLAETARDHAASFEFVIREELARAEMQAMDRAHLATLGDKPFMGCCPCEPDDPRVLASAAPNPAAQTIL
jgi:hypothetical protein